MEQLGSRWTDFSETLQKGLLITLLLKNSSLFKLGQSTRILTETYLNLFSLGACFFGWEYFQINVVG
jgi:hypothetical protein